MPSGADIAVIGGGVVGLTSAIVAKRRWPDAQVVVLEKEQRCGLHASGRNSGVVHAGLYYEKSSYKAKLTVEGNLRLREWCSEHGLPYRPCGKLVVARDELEQAGLEELQRRAAQNGVTVRRVSSVEAREIEPAVRAPFGALWCPTTGAVEPASVMASYATEARRLGVHVLTDTRVVDHRRRSMVTTKGDLEAGFVLNTAGLYADVVARRFGAGQDYRIIPFRGTYLVGDPSVVLRCHVYPVPDLQMPFLGVHFTVTNRGAVKIGPTAQPLPWKEAYGSFAGFNARELVDVGRHLGCLTVHNADVRRLAWAEAQKSRKADLLRQARELASVSGSWRWGRSGIRAQLVRLSDWSLVMDFVWEQRERSLHVLNAVSPAFTCAWPLAETLVDLIDAESD